MYSLTVVGFGFDICRPQRFRAGAAYHSASASTAARSAVCCMSLFGGRIVGDTRADGFTVLLDGRIRVLGISVPGRRGDINLHTTSLDAHIDVYVLRQVDGHGLNSSRRLIRDHQLVVQRPPQTKAATAPGAC